MLKWPDRNEVDSALRRFAERQRHLRPGLLRLGYFGSYARGDWGVGSDIDLIAVIDETDTPFHDRPLAWDLTDLPVPAEVLVYTQAEWQRLEQQGGRFASTIRREAVWL